MDARRLGPHRTLVIVALAFSVGGLLVGCSGAGTTSSKEAAVPPPTPNPVTKQYVALVHDYWTQYVGARSNGAIVCLNNVDAPRCRERAAAILPVHQMFLANLNANPPPPNFAADDQIFRSELPKAIERVKTMIAAAESGDKQAIVAATNAYVNTMIPSVTSALDHVDPSVTHD